MSTSPGKRKEQENAKQKDNKDIGGNKELLSSMGKLSLNVKAVPYVPKQDGGVQSEQRSEPKEENGNSSTKNDQVRFNFIIPVRLVCLLQPVCQV